MTQIISNNKSSLSSVKALLLDMDGTLFDSERIHKDAWQMTAAEFGIPLDDKAYSLFIGQRFEECVEMLTALAGEGFDPAPYLARMAVIEADLKSEGVPFRDGALALLEYALREKFRLALVTSSRPETIEANFAGSDWLQHFEVIVSGNDVTCAKPNPEGYLLACQQLDLLPENTVAVEDTNTGAAAAIAAGCHTVVAPDKLLPVTAEIAANSLAVCDSLHEIIPLLGHMSD
ncbi:HAD family hydrolase [Endozoicomonadaceae bacterium StTr2]